MAITGIAVQGDAINLLKGEQAKPDTKPSRKKPNEDISSEEERIKKSSSKRIMLNI